LVVLLNGGTASGAEIIAGALHDNARATLIGTRSFGIGTSQTIYPLAGGNRGGIRLTTVRYFTPTGGYIQAKGIDPDIEVVQDEPEGTKSKATGEATLARHLPGQGSEQGGSQSYVPAAPTDDKALQRAFAELRKK
jgi:carboxyl-terminal processing protease